MRIVVGITGASGTIYGIRLLEALKKLDVETHLIMSNWALENLKLETDYSSENVKKLAFKYYANKDLGAAVSSGSFRTDGMVVIPCSMKTLAAIAHGYSDSLIQRAADVTMKERRKLILVPRETPLSSIHLENMLKLSRLGVVIMPPMPAFYHKPKDIIDIVDHLVARILDQLKIEHQLSSRWGE
ncbi:MAG: 3-octaprenyl-4-hydroxybenzoate carboxy-lyase [Peptococcaceae bacterium]|jgi:4-hydroxy-3-polyprenylbenzoate decarboxylase|nr:3-octaprenyl-4-hydroxybenzoate carboxy-lyase [Peptococcaceae bacterium]